MAGGGIKINNNSIRGGADGITYTPRIGADGLLYFDPNRRGYNSIGGFVIKGEDGRDGVDGLPGRDGAKGEKGATGAKLVAMVPDPANTGDGNKYTMYFDDGTVAEFVAPRGEKGDQGEKGEKGDPGEKGEKGADGKDAEIIPTLEGNEPDKAPSVQAVNEGLAGKVSSRTPPTNHSYAYGVNSKGENTVYKISQHGTAGDIVKYDKPTVAAANGMVVIGTFGAAVPVEPYQVANKKYVDDTAAAIRAELGSQIVLEEVEYSDIDGGFLVPGSVWPHACITEAKIVVTDWTTGEETIAAPVSMWFYSGDLYDSERQKLGECNISFDSDGCFYFEMPTGTKCIELNRAVSIDGTTQYGTPSGKCVFQKGV